MPRNKYPEETRQKILDAAKELFLEKGYENTTILDIVNNMDGLTRGAFYHHFKSKEEVLDQIAEDMFFENNPFATVQHLEGLTGLQKLHKAIFNTAFADMDESHQRLVRDTIALLESPSVLARQFDFNRMIATEYIQPLMEEGMADGSIAPQNPRWLAELLLLLSNIWTNPHISPATPEELVEKLILMADIFEGLGCPLFDEESISAAEDLIEVHFPEVDASELKEKFMEG